MQVPTTLQEVSQVCFDLIISDPVITSQALFDHLHRLLARKNIDLSEIPAAISIKNLAKHRSLFNNTVHRNKKHWHVRNLWVRLNVLMICFIFVHPPNPAAETTEDRGSRFEKKMRKSGKKIEKKYQELYFKKSLIRWKIDIKKGWQRCWGENKIGTKLKSVKYQSRNKISRKYRSKT